MAALIDVRNIVFSYGSSTILNSVSMDAPDGQFVAVIGPSGCGKSTLLRIIAGLIKPNSGVVLYDGKEVTAPIRDMSFVFQDFALLPWLTNRENVELGLYNFDLTDDEKEAKASEILGRMGLGGFEESYPNALSGGMKQRVGIARAIISSPRVLLMDEPFSALDALTAESLRSEVMEMLLNKDISVNCIMMITHNVEEAVEMADRIVVLSDKPAIVKGVKEVTLKRPRNTHSKDFVKVMDEVYGMLTSKAGTA